MLAVLGVLFIVVRLAVGALAVVVLMAVLGVVLLVPAILCLVPVLVFMVADVIIPAHRGGLGKHT